MELEEDRRYHLHRALAQIAERSDVLNDKWVRSFPDEARNILSSNADALDRMGKCVFEPKDHKAVTLDAVCKWVVGEMERGRRIVCVDPVTAATTGERSWADELEFIGEVKAAAKRFEASVVLVTHPKKGAQGSTLDDLAGSSAYQRLTSTVLWLSQMKKSEDREVSVETALGATRVVECDRMILVRKARNGVGVGKKIAFRFNGASVTFSELGVVTSV